MRFARRLMMTIRWSTFEFLGGVAVACASLYGLLTYQAPAPDSPFASPIPFAALYFCGVVVGVLVALWAHHKANHR